jgi:hypothetical protein
MLLSSTLSDRACRRGAGPVFAPTHIYRQSRLSCLTIIVGARACAGDRRVTFTEDPTTIIVVAVGHRGEIYEDRNSAMTKVQFMRTPHGDELAVLPGGEYERLTTLAAEAEEDAGTPRLVARREVAVPKAVGDRIAAGENSILYVRDWRVIAPVVSDAAGIGQRCVAASPLGALGVDMRTGVRVAAPDAGGCMLDGRERVSGRAERLGGGCVRQLRRERAGRDPRGPMTGPSVWPREPRIRSYGHAARLDTRSPGQNLQGSQQGER